MGLEGPSPSHCHASFWSQANALLRKNLTFQKRNIKTNIWLISFPVFLCSLILVLQRVADKEWNEPSDTECGCSKEAAWCYYEYSINGGIRCAFPNPPEWPPLLQIPLPEYRAVRSEAVPFTDLPDESCRTKGSCPAAFLITGNNHSLGSILAGNMLPSSFTLNSSDALFTLADNVIGSEFTPGYSNFQDPAFTSDAFIYTLQRHCPPDFNSSVFFRHSSDELRQEVFCVEGLPLWRNSSSDVNDELYRGYAQGNSEGETNEIFAAYGFSNSNKKNFNVSIWYNSTYKTDKGNGLSTLVRVSRLVNLASNAYLQYLRGHGTKMLFEFVKEMPKPETLYNLDMSSLLGTFFFALVILHLFPVVLSSLVYEKQQKLRIMMKMHGLGDWPYWMISYVYFLSISLIYMLCFMIFGSVIGLKFFKLNDYSIQFVFYLVYINLQTSVAFLVALMFSNVKTATVTAYIGVFGTGIIGNYLFLSFVEDASFPRQGITLMELYPGFSLNRGLYEFAQSSFIGNYLGTNGMRWEDFGDSSNGMREVLIIMLVEWLMVLFVAYYIDSVLSSGSGTRSLIFLENFRKKFLLSFQKPNSWRQSPKHRVQMEKDVSQEREKVDQLLLEPDTSYAIICDNLKKVYPGKDGNPDKFVVRGLSLALRRGECFGMLGPNGAGKSSFINMVKTVTFLNLNEIEGNSGNALKRFIMISLIKPTSGTAFVEGLDIRTHMSSVYTSMGVCPQHDLLWETLTGREHLLFYGRLKNLTGSALTQAVEDSLKSFNLFHGGIPDKQTRKYSGGMKRRLSVAISLIGDPKVVYMDEPGTGLDPASRKNLWNVMKRAKQDRAIILTTHSMEEAEVLCDRVGIFIDGTLQCIGNPKELIARYGGSYVFTITTSSVHERDVENLVKSSLFPNAKRTYHISGTQKFELPKNEVRIADIFKAVKIVKNRFTVYAWNLADATLEEVFIKVARGAQEQEVNAVNA